MAAIYIRPFDRSEWEILRTLGKDRFIFLTAHYLEEVEQLAVNIGIINDRKIVSFGTLSELRKTAKFQYSIKLPPKVAILQFKDGEGTTDKSRSTQVLTNEDEAFSLAKIFAEQGLKFAITPVSLEDVFFPFLDKKRGMNN